MDSFQGLGALVYYKLYNLLLESVKFAGGDEHQEVRVPVVVHRKGEADSMLWPDNIHCCFGYGAARRFVL